ncbi:MAG: WYL domain-containing protein [Candidatus Baltobacteraceae bacterium]
MSAKDTAVEPKFVLLLRLLGAIEEGRYDFETLKARIASDAPPSTRSLRRYLATLAEAGFPWYFDRASGTYRFREGYGMRRLHLSSHELLGLLAMRGMAASLGGNIAASIDEITQKLIGVADRSTTNSTERPAVRIHMSDIALDPERTAIFELLRGAQHDARTVHFAYVDKRGRRSHRTVDPYGFVVSGGRAYLVAFDQGRKDRRVFALDNVSAARLGVRRFEPPSDFDIEAFAADSISGIMHGGSPVAVTVRFAAVVASAAKADRIVRERSVVDRADGSVEITYAVSDPDELVRWTLRWGAEAEILAPAHVRANAGAIAAAIAARYAGPKPRTKRSATRNRSRAAAT